MKNLILILTLALAGCGQNKAEFEEQMLAVSIRIAHVEHEQSNLESRHEDLARELLDLKHELGR